MGPRDVASVVVDNRNEIHQFLTSRRAGITPEQAGPSGRAGVRLQDGLRLLASWAATLDQLDLPATSQAPEEA